MEERDLSVLLEDLRAVKNAVRKNDRLFREVLMPRYFGVMSLLTGLLITVHFLIFQLLVIRYGRYAQLPWFLKILLWSLVVVILVIGSIIKWRYLTFASRKVKPGLGWAGFFREFFVGPILPVYLAVLTGSLGLILFLCLSGMPWLVLPLLALFLGVIWNLIGGMTGCREYYVMGFWLIVSGVAGMFFARAYPFIQPAFNFGIGMLLFGILGLIDGHRSRNSGEPRP